MPTMMSTKDPLHLTLGTVCGGGLERQFQDAIEEIKRSYRSGKVDEEAARKIVMTVEVTREDGTYKFVASSKTTIPQAKACSGYGEEDADGTMLSLTPVKQTDMFEQQDTTSGSGTGPTPLRAVNGGAGASSGQDE